MIRLSNDCDSKFCNALRNCLFYLDLISLGADVVVTKLLKKSAKKALEVKAFNPNKGVDETAYKKMINTLEGLVAVKVINTAESELKLIDDAIEKLKIEIKVPKNKLGPAQSAQKIQVIIKEIKKKGKNFDPGKAALKKAGIKLPKTQNGLGVCVDFAKSKYLYPATGNQKNIVKIKLTGKDKDDFKLANELGGFGKNQPDDYTWHHLDDFNPVNGTCTMQLAETSTHVKCNPHVGGVEIVKQYFPEANLYPQRNKSKKIKL